VQLRDPLTEVIEHQIKGQLARDRAEQDERSAASLATREAELCEEFAAPQAVVQRLLSAFRR
jgi:hypothetical protein